MPIATLTIDLNAKLANLQASFDKAAQLSEKSAKRMEAAFNGVNTALATLGAGISVAGIVGFTKSAIDAADSANDMAQKYGLAVEDIAAFDLAARQSGVTLEDVGAGLKAFSKFALENSDALKAAGISTTSTRESFMQFADVVKALPDGLEKSALAQKAYGKAGADLIPLLNLGSQGLQEASDKTAEYGKRLALLAPQADTFNDKLEELKLGTSALAINLASNVIGPLTDVATRMAEVTTRTGSLRGALAELADSAGSGFLNSWRAVFKDVQVDLARFDIFIQKLKGDDAAVLKTQEHIKQLYTEMAALGGSQASSAGKAPQQTANDLKDGNAALEEQAKKYQDLIKQILSGGSGGGAKPKAAKPAKETDPLGDLIAGLSTKEADRLEQMRAKWTDLLDPMEAFRREYQEIDELTREGYFTSDEALAAIKKVDEELAKLGESTKTAGDGFEDLKRAIEGWGKDAAQAMVDFAITGKSSFSDMTQSILSDIAKMLVYKNITAPLANQISGANWGAIGSAVAGFFGFADGGVMTNSGPIPLKKYASGGIANSTQLAMFGEGSTPEAYVPLPDGRTIPVTMRGAGTVVQINVQNNAGDVAKATATSSTDSSGNTQILVMVEKMEGLMGQRIRKGTGLAPVFEDKYGLNPAAGARW